MQTTVSDQPYVFTPPKRSRFWPWLMRHHLPRYLRRTWGVASHELTGLDALRGSLRSGHGVVLAPNHCRPCDPMVVGLLSRALRQPLFCMASAHLFRERTLQSWLLPRVGAFSVHREGLDREALRTGIHVVAKAERPLMIFPEGVITRTNDRLIGLQPGVSFLARAAARLRAEKDGGRVVIHPVAVRYTFRGELDEALSPVLDELERMLSWEPFRGAPALERVTRICHGLLALREVEVFGAAQTGGVRERLSALLDGVLRPLEEEWLAGRTESHAILRVKALRKAILHDLVHGHVPESERQRRWRQLMAIEMAQQVCHFPPDYLGSTPTPERLVETVERCLESLGEPESALLRPWHASVTVGEPIEVPCEAVRGASADPVLSAVAGSLERLLGLRTGHAPTLSPALA